MKNYSEKFIDDVQESINKGQYALHIFNSFGELPHCLYINGVTVRLTEQDGRRMTEAVYDYTFNHDDYIEWKKEAITVFYCRDWKRTPENFSRYIELDTFASNGLPEKNNIPVRVLLRQISENEVNTPDSDYYRDININGQPYAIIKAFNPTTETYAKKSALETLVFNEKAIYDYKFYNAEETEADEDDDEDTESLDNVSMSDIPVIEGLNMEELF